MRPYSMDLRQKVLAAYDRGDISQRQLAARFGLALSTVQSWLRRRRLTGCADAD
ncbi:MAG: helix-turn-helix domain-containing protein [Bacteroidota bacterium]